MSKPIGNPDPTPKASVPKRIDLGELDTAEASDKGAEIELLHPTTKEPIGIFIGVLGKHSQVFRDIVRERTDKRIAEEAQNSKRGKDSKLATADEVESRAVELLTACTTHWRSETRDAKGKVVSDEPVLTFKGEDLPFNVPNAQRVYKTMIWVREQVDQAIGDLELFIKA